MIAWDESGAGPPMVLVHGITEDRHVWDRITPLLADDFRCVRVDLRGHGDSPVVDDLSALAMAEDLAAVLTDAGIDEPPILVGHSLGGVVVTLYATGSRTRAVVNVDQPLRVGEFARALQPFADALRGPDWRATLDVIFQSLGIDELDAAARKYVIDKIDATPQSVILGVWQLVLDTPPDELDALFELTLPGISGPYLALHGGDPGSGYTRWLQRLIPTASVEVWDGVGHFVQLADPERLATRIKEFVSP